MASKAILETVNDQQEIFCQDYATRLHAGKAAENAGYAREYGYQLLKLPHIIERIAEIQRNGGIRMIVTQGKVVREAAYLAYSDITDVVGVNTVEALKALPENVRRAIQSIKMTRTPILRDGSADRRSQRTTELLDATSESAQTCHKVTDGVLYEETIEIKMHPKMEAIKLLALVTQAVKDPEDLRKQAPAFTGMAITVAQPKKALSSKKRSENDE
jgi:phage terminase small subunit